MKLNLRPSNEADIENLHVSLSVDPFHQGQSVTNWTSPGGDLITFFDEETNEVLFHVRMERIMRLHFQHSLSADRKRRIVGMKQAILWLKQKAKDLGFRELIYESAASKLIKFFHRFGFVEATNEQKVQL
jgi:formamidopyrimidine-DNA glycosylase